MLPFVSVARRQAERLFWLRNRGSRCEQPQNPQVKVGSTPAKMIKHGDVISKQGMTLWYQEYLEHSGSHRNVVKRMEIESSQIWKWVLLYSVLISFNPRWCQWYHTVIWSKSAWFTCDKHASWTARLSVGAQAQWGVHLVPFHSLGSSRPVYSVQMSKVICILPSGKIT